MMVQQQVDGDAAERKGMESSAQVKELALDESSSKSKEERGGKTECLGRDTGACGIFILIAKTFS